MCTRARVYLVTKNLISNVDKIVRKINFWRQTPCALSDRNVPFIANTRHIKFPSPNKNNLIIIYKNFSFGRFVSFAWNFCYILTNLTLNIMAWGKTFLNSQFFVSSLFCVELLLLYTMVNRWTQLLLFFDNIMMVMIWNGISFNCVWIFSPFRRIFLWIFAMWYMEKLFVP